MQENTKFGENSIYVRVKKIEDSFGSNHRAGSLEKAACPTPIPIQASKVQYLDFRGKGKFRNKQALILCRYDDYGIGDLKRRVMTKKKTYLYRELMLRLNATKITEKFYIWKEKGMFNWKAYGKHKESIWKSFDILRHAFPV